MAKKKIDLLTVIPCPKKGIRTELLDNGKIVVAIPRFKSEWMQRHFTSKRFPPYIRVPLDTYGSSVWKEMNSKRTIKEIVNKLSVEFADMEQLEERVAQYFLQLAKDKLIDFTLRKE